VPGRVEHHSDAVLRLVVGCVARRRLHLRTTDVRQNQRSVPPDGVASQEMLPVPS